MSYVRGFGVEVLAGGRSQLVTYGDYVAIPNRSEYKIRLINSNHRIADVSVYVDGISAGMFRLDPNVSIVIERPANVRQKFTFLSETSEEALAAGAFPGNENNGQFDIIFKPAKEHKVQEYSSMVSVPESLQGTATPALGSPRMSMLRSGVPEERGRGPYQYRSGVTVLGENSGQQFIQVPRLREKDIDFNATAEIIFRLVIEQPPYRTMAASRTEPVAEERRSLVRQASPELQRFEPPPVQRSTGEVRLPTRRTATPQRRIPTLFPEEGVQAPVRSATGGTRPSSELNILPQNIFP